MISSIVVTGCHNIGMNSSKKICINDTTFSVEKDIPFIRYRFDKYDEEEYAYIDKMKKQFSLSTHLAEINVNEQTATILEEIGKRFNNTIVRYVYIDITDADVVNGKLDENIMNLLNDIVVLSVDRIMLRDKTTTLDTVSAKRIIKSICTDLGTTDDMIGICSSPLSFGEYACLTAVKARELMSLYSSVVDVALPSANHQCMNCCGCIRYVTVTSEQPAPVEGKTKSTNGKSKEAKSNSGDSSTNKSSTHKKTQNLMNMFNRI